MTKVAIGVPSSIRFALSPNKSGSHFREKSDLLKLEESKKYYEQQIAVTKRELEQLKTNPAVLERYAREKFMMKKEKEDLFRIREDKMQATR